MLLIGTGILRIYDSEVNYNLYVEELSGKYFFKPSTYENRNIYPPSFWVEQKGAEWEFEGIADKSLKTQAIEELSYCLNFNLDEPVDVDSSKETDV